jgi:protein-S-isoprenylcysteine O-methyltransferase Ste14
MRPLAYVWPHAVVFWMVFVWVFAPEFRVTGRTRSLARTQDAGSLWVIMVIQCLAMGAAFSIAFVFRFGVLPRQQLWFWLGLATMIEGSLLRRHCFRMLGSSFTGVVVVREDQTIVDRGAYRWVRHPSYTAAVLVFAGMAVALGNWISIVVMLIAIPPTYAYRVRVEERALVQTLGDPYRAYMQRTKRFIPMII